MVQVEDVFQLGSEIAVQVGEESEDAEQSGDNDERHKVIGRVGSRRCCGLLCPASFSPFPFEKCLISAVFPLRRRLSATISGARQIAVKDSRTGKPLQTYPNHS